MAGMFGGNRGFGGSLGQSPLQRLAGGIGMGFGGMRFPQVLTNELLGGRGRTSMFGGGGGGMFGGGGGGGNEPSQAAMLNYASLEGMGQRQFAGNQAQLDRELENNLLQQQLRNALQLQGMRGQNSLDLQGLVNSGALDQIGARGQIEQSLLGRRLSSEENQLAQQLGFNREALQGNLWSQVADRDARERMHGAGLTNALELQSQSDQSAFQRLQAQLLGQRDLTGMEIQGRQGLQQLVGQQALEQLGERGRMEMGLLRARGQQSLAELREQAGYNRDNLMQQLGLQRELGLGGLENQRHLGELNAWNQMMDTQGRNALGWAGLENQRYGIDANLDMAGMRNEQQDYQFAQQHALAQQQAEQQAASAAALLKQRQFEFDNPQPLQVQPPPTRPALQHQAIRTAIEALPDGSPEEIIGLADQYMDLMDQAAGGQGPAQPRAVPRQSARQLIESSTQADALRRKTGSQLVDALAPVLGGVQYDAQGRLTPESRRELDRRGINTDVLDQLNGYDPWLEWGDTGPISFLPYLLFGENKAQGQRRTETQGRARRLRAALVPN